jgi:tripeptidyl-peptidase-1
MKQKDLPYVITTSYGDDEQTVPRDYAKRVCAELAQLGARGITLLFSSGDNGVGKNGTCVSNDGSNTRKFLPSFPASCPYVTTVGGTRDFNPERVAFDVNNGYVAGGGWSEYFPRPDYQVSP